MNDMTPDSPQIAPKSKGIQSLASGRSDTFKLDPALIQIKFGWNARDFDDPENQAHVEALAESIAAVGVLEPLTVVMENGVPYLTNGESRLRAVRLLLERGVEVKTVPVQTEPRHASEADRLASQIVRNSGKAFTPFEQCSVFVRLKGLGWTDKEIAARAGLTVVRVQQIIGLNTVPAEARDMVRRGEVSATTVQRASRAAESPAALTHTLKTAVAKAKESGKTKVRPRDLKGPSKKPSPGPSLRRLLERVVAAEYTPPGGDQFGGSGTRLVAIETGLWREITAAVEAEFQSAI